MGNSASYEAAHIFPIAYQAHWIQHNFSRWITIPPVSGSDINSVQNVLLLRSHIHALFDNYDLIYKSKMYVFDGNLQIFKADLLEG